MVQGLVLVGAGVILVFQGVQTYIIDSYSLHSASGGLAFSFARTTAHRPSDARSPRSSFFSTVNRWLWLPIICTRNVQIFGLWHWQHSVGSDCPCNRSPLVRDVDLLSPPSLAVPDLEAFSPILFWKFGERIRNGSVYAVKTGQ